MIYIPGYHNDIHQAVWRRPLTLGAPRLWSNCWLCLCLYLGLLMLVLLGLRWVLVPLVLWAIGQGCLALLTHWDEQFDDVLIAYLSRRYHHFYDAG